VLVNRGFGDPVFPAWCNDDHESVRLVLDHLMALGHRRIAHVAGPAGSSTGQAARRHSSPVCRKHKLAAQVVSERFTREAAAAADGCWTGRFHSTAHLRGETNMIAMGVLDALRERGLRVPGDIRWSATNDMPLVDLIDPPLTTVRVAVDQMSRQAAQMLPRPGRAGTRRPVTRMLLSANWSTATPPAVQ
jgi:LacI family transcriptional regulator